MLFMFVYAAPSHASETTEREIEKRVTYDPWRTLHDAERDLRAARERGDKASELKAIELYLTARGNTDPTDSPPYSENIERGIVLARELGDNQTLCTLMKFKSLPLLEEMSEKLILPLDEAINFAKKHHLDRCLADAYVQKGNFDSGNYRNSESMVLFNSAYQIYEMQHDNFGMAKAFLGIANLYSGADTTRENQIKNIEYLNRALAFLNPEQYRSSATEIYHRLGLAYYRIQNFTEARGFFEAALRLARELRFDSDVGLGHYRLGQLAMDENRLNDALVHFDAALPQLEKSRTPKSFLVGALVAYAQVLARLGRNKDSLDALVRARALLPEINQHARVEWLYYSTAAELYAQFGNYREAYQHLTKLRQLDERLTKAATDKLANELQIGFEVHLKETENNLLRAQEKQSETQRLALMLALILSLVLLIGAGVLAFFLRQRAAAAKILAHHHLALAAAEQQANQAKTTFLANMSHELRSPLNAILGFTELALRSPELPPSIKEDLTTVAKSGEHLYTLINQVLDLSKLEAGRTTLNEVNFDLYSLLDELIDTFALAAKQKGLQLTLETEQAVPQYLRADMVKLHQVLINLVNNALKFTQEGGIVLRVGNVKTNNVPADDGRLLFAVIDSGPGIAPDELAKLGETFVQAQAGRESREGTGLGLAISRNFVQLMGGELRFSSEVGQGTTVSVILPVHVVEAESVHVLKSKVKRRVVALVPNQPTYRLLAVDDRPENRRMLTRLLAPLGFEVREASNGQEAVSMWESWEPQLIWMDIRMPIMDGHEATRRIKQTGKGHLPVIVALTASSFEEDRNHILSIGCDDFLRKPFREEELFELLHKHLGVEFLYADVTPTAPVELPDKAHLAALPIELRRRLALALKGLDDDEIEKTITKIAEHDAKLAECLALLAKNYKHSFVMSLLEE